MKEEFKRAVSDSLRYKDDPEPEYIQKKMLHIPRPVGVENVRIPDRR